MSIFERFGSGKAKGDDQDFRGAEEFGSVTLPGEKELRLGNVPGRKLDPVRAVGVHEAEASQIEKGMKRTELQEKIKFVSSQVDRYIATLATLRGQHVSGKKIEDLEAGIKHGMDIQEKLERDLADLG